MFLSRLVPRTAALARVSVARSTNYQRMWIPRAFYAAGGGGLTRDVITSRILDTLKGFEKIDPAKVRVHTFRVSED
jgi:NADH dehydrogenase (ubiquinone) 1 alpha/beta subcomplex 1